MSCRQAQALRPNREPYIAVLSPKDWGSFHTPWDALWRAIDEIPRMPMDGRLECGVRILSGIGIDAPITGALIVGSACEGLNEFHQLAAWMAYRRGCRRFLVVFTRSEQLNDNELADFAVRDAADTLRSWLGDVEVDALYGSASSARDRSLLPANLPFVRQVWKHIERWHQSPGAPHDAPNTPKGTLAKVIEALEAQSQRVLGFVGNVHAQNIEVAEAERCPLHGSRSEYFILDFTQPGHGLPFDGTWVLRCCTTIWHSSMLWQDGTCFRIDRSPVGLNHAPLQGTPGFMMPSLDALQRAERGADIQAILRHVSAWRTMVGPSDEEMYWAVEAILGMSHAPGYHYLGGSIVAPSHNHSMRCQSCQAWMPFACKAGGWGDTKLYLWICPHCPDEAFVNFQR